VHEVIGKAGRDVFRCSLSGRSSDRWLEVPAWMFDRAASAAWHIAVTPHVDLGTLGGLVMLLKEAAASSPPDSLRESSMLRPNPAIVRECRTLAHSTRHDLLILLWNLVRATDTDAAP